MTHTPRIPPEQRSASDAGGKATEDTAEKDGRDTQTGAQSGQPGDADVNLDQQGRFGNLSQNLTALQKVHHR